MLIFATSLKLFNRINPNCQDMVKFSLIILFWNFILSSCTAQKNLNVGTFQIHGKTFKIAEPIMKSLNGKGSIIISNPNYKYQNVPPPSPKVLDPFPMQKKDIYFDLEQVRKIVYSRLNTKLPQLKLDGETLTMNFTFSQNGSLVNVGYILRAETRVSLEDVKNIDDLLKSEIKATFTGTDYLQYEVISYSFPTIIF